MSEASESVAGIGGRLVGAGRAPYVIAEISANHRGRFEIAERIVRLAAEAGADAVKLQTYTPDSMTLDLHEPPFVVGAGTLWRDRSLFDLYQEAQTPWEWHGPLFELARELGLHCFSSPFDRAAVDFLEQFEPPAHKIASFEIGDLDLIAYAASTGRPLIISTGMATIDEIDRAVDTAHDGGAGGIVLLRCNSAYPADPAEMDLLTIVDMARRWSVPIGLSDHTHGTTAAVVATGLGAAVIEKHLIPARADGGPDAAFSAEPAELAELIEQTRLAALARGVVRFGPSSSERASVAFKRSLFVVADVEAGELFTSDSVRAIRPAGGMEPRRLREVLGRPAARKVRRGTPLTEDLVG